MKKISSVTLYQEALMCRLLNHVWICIKDKVDDNTKEDLQVEITAVLKEWNIDLWRPL